jgi:hypothetical protein
MILEFSEAFDSVVGNALFKKRQSDLITYESGMAQIYLGDLLVRRGDRSLLKNIKSI